MIFRDIKSQFTLGNISGLGWEFRKYFSRVFFVMYPALSQVSTICEKLYEELSSAQNCTIQLK